MVVDVVRGAKDMVRAVRDTGVALAVLAWHHLTRNQPALYNSPTRGESGVPNVMGGGGSEGGVQEPRRPKGQAWQKAGKGKAERQGGKGMRGLRARWQFSRRTAWPVALISSAHSVMLLN